MGYYVDEEGVVALKAYAYEGEDKSYLYRYVLTPMNKKLEQYIPIWLAPNVITLMSLVITTSAYVLCLLNSPRFEEPVPRWLSLYAAAALFLYQTLDNLDGRQARRTKSSSPLGLLFDHGVDSLNVTVSTLMLASILQCGTTFKVFGLWFTTYIPFVFATWEEYYTGKLTLGRLNGPTDGVILCVIFCLIEAVSPGFWSMTFQQSIGPSLAGTWIGGCQNNVGILIVAFFAIPVTCFANIYAVCTRSRRVWKHIYDPVLILLPFIFFGLSRLIMGIIFSISYLLYSHSRFSLWTGLPLL